MTAGVAEKDFRRMKIEHQETDERTAKRSRKHGDEPLPLRAADEGVTEKVSRSGA